jgi:hypothetical protein
MVRFTVGRRIAAVPASASSAGAYASSTRAAVRAMPPAHQPCEAANSDDVAFPRPASAAPPLLLVRVMGGSPGRAERRSARESDARALRAAAATDGATPLVGRAAPLAFVADCSSAEATTLSAELRARCGSGGGRLSTACETAAAARAEAQEMADEGDAALTSLRLLEAPYAGSPFASGRDNCRTASRSERRRE